MNYEDLVAKRTERETKDQKQAKRKEKRDRKYKSQKKTNASKSIIDEQSEKSEIAFEEFYRALMTQM